MLKSYSNSKTKIIRPSNKILKIQPDHSIKPKTKQKISVQSILRMINTKVLK